MWELIHALEAAEAKQECAVDDPYMDADADQRNRTETNDKAATGRNPYIQPSACSQRTGARRAKGDRRKKQKKRACPDLRHTRGGLGEEGQAGQTQTAKQAN